MSEYNDPDYRSEYEAPPYTIVDQETIDGQVVTTVIIDGEVAVFEVAAVTRRLAKQAVQPLAERFNQVVQGFDQP